jgi:drug/metabolite transporter (DMT)-like permease
MIGVALSAISSVLWGASDYAAGLATRRAGVLSVTAWAYLAAAVISVAVYPVDVGEWSPAALWSGIAAGVASVVGFLCFYAGLARAAMGVVAALVGATEAAVPVFAAVLWRGESLPVLGWLGILVAVLGGVLIGMADSGGPNASSWVAIVLAVVAGAAFGLAVVALGGAPVGSGLIASTLEVVLGAGVMAALVIAAVSAPRAHAMLASIGLVAARRPRRATVLVAVGAGGLLGLANIVLMIALRFGPLAAVGVVVSLYPVTTAVLARALLTERLTRAQLVGIAAAIGGCVLLGIS